MSFHRLTLAHRAEDICEFLVRIGAARILNVTSIVEAGLFWGKLLFFKKIILFIFIIIICIFSAEEGVEREGWDPEVQCPVSHGIAM